MLDSVKSSNLILKGAIKALLEMLEIIEATRPVEEVHKFLCKLGNICSLILLKTSQVALVTNSCKHGC